MSELRHVDVPECWCNPRKTMICPECNGPTPECWRCGGDGVVEHDGAPDRPALFVHNYIGGFDDH